ncbi:MAG: PQQ-binding-like beta-propeller repeat protein [Phycisphaerae bacterium]|nr:PQQ-binding-like beta-propeller repeat protein [Phycisphaerae bacterium]
MEFLVSRYRSLFASLCLTGGFAASMIAGLSGCAASTQKTESITPAVSSAGPFPADFEAWSKVKYRLDWSGFPFPLLGQHRTQEVVPFPDMLAVLDASSNVAVLETSTGERRWGDELANPLTKFVAVSRDPMDAGRIIVSSQSEAFVISATTGTLLARETFARVVNTRPVIAGNIMIFGTSTGEVLGHLLGRNLKAWGFQGKGPITADPVRLADGTIGIVSQAGDVMFLTPRGNMVGRGTILGGLMTNPVTDGNLMYMAGLDQSVWCFAPSGALIWRHRTASPLRTQPTMQNGVLYCDIPREGLTALEGLSGKVLWSNPKVSGTVIGSRGGRALVFDSTGKTLALVDPVDGALVDSILLPGIVRIVADAQENPNLYAVSDKGVVGKFIPRD